MVYTADGRGCSQAFRSDPIAHIRVRVPKQSTLPVKPNPYVEATAIGDPPLADVDIAMGTGTNVAMQGAGVTLVKGDLSGIARAAVPSRATMRNIRQNLLFAFGYNALGIPIAAGVLRPAFGLLLSPMIAAAAMALSSVSVVTDASGLRNIGV